MCRVSDDGPITSPSTRCGAVVRKPSGKEPAGSGRRWCRLLYGDFAAADEDAAGDEVGGEAIAEPGGGGEEAGVGREQECEADRGFAEC